MMRAIPPSGINLFQLIYILVRDYEKSSGKSALNLSLGNPDIIPDEIIRKLKSQIQLESKYELHTYAEDTNIDQFTQGMVRVFSGVEYEKFSHLKAVSISGIKPATSILPLACGLLSQPRDKFCYISNLPAYDVIGTWGQNYLGAQRDIWPLTPDNGMRLDLSWLKNRLQQQTSKPKLIFVIRPGNPAPVGANSSEWKEIIKLCIEHKIRLVNDAAYSTLAQAESHTPLIQVAKDYPELEWAEMYSMSKSYSDPGARLGVFVGHKDFVEDFILIKGNTDSGPVPSLMATYGRFFKDTTTAKRLLNETNKIYEERLNYLIPKLKGIGLKQACETSAGFFTLWKVPKKAFGQPMASAEAFNRMVIEKTGIVGVHFQGPGGEYYIRYAVCADVLNSQFKQRFEAEIAKINPEY